MFTYKHTHLLFSCCENVPNVRHLSGSVVGESKLLLYKTSFSTVHLFIPCFIINIMLVEQSGTGADGEEDRKGGLRLFGRE